MELIIILILIIALSILAKKRPQKKKKANEPFDYSTVKTAYAPKWMFTQKEKQAFHKLTEIASKKGMYLFAKVRLFDLIEPNKTHKNYKSNLYRIQAKHVDFVLAKNNLIATHIIELDDSSHDTPDRKERDKFVDTILTSCGYKVLHTREIQDAEIEKFLS